MSDNIKVNRDIIIYDEKFYYLNDNKKRFLLEQFLDFKKFKKNLSEKEKNKNKNNVDDDGSIQNKIINLILNLGKNDDKFDENSDENKIGNIFLQYLLFNKEKLSEKDYTNISNKLKQSGKYLIKFISVLITYYKSIL